MVQLFVPEILRRKLKTPQEYASSIKKNKLFTGNGPSKTQKKQRRNHTSKELNKTMLESEFTPEKWAHLMQFIATTTRLNEKGLIHDTLRTKNESERMPVAMFHGVDVECEARDK